MTLSIREACPECGSPLFKKNGHIHNGKQTHQGKTCGRQFVVDATNRVVDAAHRFTHAQAVAEHEQDQTSVTRFVPSAFDGGQQLLDLKAGYVSAFVVPGPLFCYSAHSHHFVSCSYTKTHEKASKTPLRKRNMRQLATKGLMFGISVMRGDALSLQLST